jgi:hypothetical protein
MQDVYLPIADALARPLRHVKRSGVVVLLYQLWRADFAALGRLSLICREASMAVRGLLWVSTPLGQRERARRAQMGRARAFLLGAAPLVASASWTRAWSAAQEYVHLRSLTSVGFNGRLRIREYYFPGRRMRLHMQRMGYEDTFPLRFGVGVTLTGAPPDGGRLLILTGLLKSYVDVWTGTFTDHGGALSFLRYFTFMGREYWNQLQPAEAFQRFERYTLPMLANLEFEAIVEQPV